MFLTFSLLIYSQRLLDMKSVKSERRRLRRQKERGNASVSFVNWDERAQQITDLEATDQTFKSKGGKANRFVFFHVPSTGLLCMPQDGTQRKELQGEHRSRDVL